MRQLQGPDLDRPSPAALQGQPRTPVVVVLDRLRSAHNVGSVLRIADAFRLQRVVLCGYTPGPPHRSVLKVALGAEDTVPWGRAETAAEALQDLKAQGYEAVALEQTDVSESLTTFRPSEPFALVVGNEVDGVSPQALAECTRAVEIPQYGAKHSLNVSVAFGIAAYGLSQALGGSEGAAD